jgi:hypothetical protein
MKATFVFIILLVGLFCLSYFPKRRFGALGLALCAGLLLSNSWTSSLTPLLEQQGIQLIAPPLSAVVAAGLILLPAVLLLFSGPTYGKTIGRVIGAIAFSLFGFVLLLSPLGSSLVFDEMSQPLYDMLAKTSSIIVVIGIGMALVDMLLTRGGAGKKSKDEH